MQRHKKNIGPLLKKAQMFQKRQKRVIIGIEVLMS